MKRCSKCGENKSRTEFRLRKGSRDGLHGWCHPCYRKYYSAAQRRWRESNPERNLELARKWRTDNAELVLSYWRQYRDKNRARLRERDRLAAHAHPERKHETQRRWRERNRAQEINRNHRRRALTATNLSEEIADLLSHPCTYCGSTENISIDHIIPLARGGEHIATNLAPACLSCNSSKGTKLLSEWDGPLALREAA